MPIIGFFLFRKEPQGALHNITPVRKRGLECLGFTVRLYIYIYPTGFSRTWILAWPSHHEQWPVGPWLIWFAVYKWIDVVLPSYIRNLRSQRMDLYEPSRNGGMECHVHPWKLTWNLKITQLKSGNIIFHPPPWLWGSKCEFSGFFQGFERFLTCCFLFPPPFLGACGTDDFSDAQIDECSHLQLYATDSYFLGGKATYRCGVRRNFVWFLWGFFGGLERPLCPIFLGNEKPLKPATIALKIGHLAFQGVRNSNQKNMNRKTHMVWIRGRKTMRKKQGNVEGCVCVWNLYDNFSS